MKIQLMSDLHLERDPGFVPVPVPGVDLLVLAGDIGSYQAGSRLKDDDFGLARFSPQGAGAAWPEVMFLPGNHEFDHQEYGATYDRLRGLCEQLGITWLESEVLVRGRVRFIGSTLWSDFDALAPADASVTQQLQLREKAFRAANFYLRKNTSLQDGQPMLAEAVRGLSLASQAWLREQLARPFDGSTVVVTHFAPSLRSADPRYGVNPGTAGFCNAMDDLLPQAEVWMHGHLHCFNDYTVQGCSAEGLPWACRVVANPLGYANKGEQAAYRPGLLIELPD
ncbi:MAG TPA: metallophosphoesterase [Ideonella sp.]|uniref:metallophosphoesterase n=1 Tax=Ideonella sp. TaxID=1929293 RepID=UPI002BF193CF|nr:metallophosphoesterase [Ideonella sp.]HSI47779.1 metallophosphoesterase [Ideonella sp.]